MTGKSTWLKQILAHSRSSTLKFPFTCQEYKEHWSIDDACEWGSVPLVASDPAFKPGTLPTYVDTYIKEEIMAEAVVRNLDPFIVGWSGSCNKAGRAHQGNGPSQVFHVYFLVQSKPKTLSASDSLVTIEAKSGKNFKK